MEFTTVFFIFKRENLIFYRFCFIYPASVMLRSFFIATVLFTCSFTMFSTEKPEIIPAPQKWQAAEGVLKLKTVEVFLPDDTTGLLSKLVSEFTGELYAVGKVEVTASADVSIIFQYADDKRLGDEGYELVIGDDVKIKANRYAGLLYGTRSLLQMLLTSKDNNTLPKGTLTDHPEYGIRMLMLDVGRKFIPFDELKDYIRTMAWVKMNELHLHLNDNSFGHYPGYRLPSEAYPELTSKDGSYTWEQIRELQDFGYVYGVTIIPEIDSPGHSLAFTNVRPDLASPYIGKKYLDILNPGSYRFMETILSEVVPHFDAKDFHIGTDEYRLYKIKDKELKEKLGEQFRLYIYYFNAFLRGKGKNCRIWSGYEHMPGNTEPDVSTIIDMWETSDAKNKAGAGYKFINSSHYYTYIVPGAPYYGVDDNFVYNEWTPEQFSNKKEQNLEKGCEALLGSGLHVWNDYGPTGYTTSEIARLSVPSMVTFSEKMWGTKGFENYKEFAPLRDKLLDIPLVSLLDRDKENRQVVFKQKNIDLSGGKSYAVDQTQGKDHVEYPWTLSMTVTRTGKGQDGEILLTSDLATVYADLEHEYKKKKEKISKRGIAVVRANMDKGKTPIDSYKPDVLVFDYLIPENKTVKLKLVGDKKKTSLYVNGKLVGSYNIQTLCPVKTMGDKNGKSFNGVIKKIEIMNYIK